MIKSIAEADGQAGRTTLTTDACEPPRRVAGQTGTSPTTLDSHLRTQVDARGARRPFRVGRLTARLERRVKQTAVAVAVPFDPSQVDGGPIVFDALAPKTREA